MAGTIISVTGISGGVAGAVLGLGKPSRHSSCGDDGKHGCDDDILHVSFSQRGEFRDRVMYVPHCKCFHRQRQELEGIISLGDVYWRSRAEEAVTAVFEHRTI